MSLNDFEIVNLIGEGHYSNVYKVKRLHDNHIYALKKVKLTDLQPKEIHNAVNQIRILASIRHPNVIGYKQAFYDLPTKSLCIVMEFADGGDLEKKITDHRNKGLYMKQEYIWDVFGQMVAGLGKLHSMGIFHRDLKSANIYLMRNGLLKIGDLNVSKVVRRQGMCETQMGAPYYSSPEVWRQEAYDNKSDMWSLGCILYEVISLKMPFRARDMQGLYKKVNRGFYKRINKSYSDDLAQVVNCLLRINSKDRKSCRQLLEMKEVMENVKKSRDADLDEKSMLLRTIKVKKNISYIGENLPSPNYMPLKYKHSSLGHIQRQKKTNPSLSMSLSLNKSSLANSQNIKNPKIQLPPVPNQHHKSAANRSKIINSSQIIPNQHKSNNSRGVNSSQIISKKSQSPKRQISSQKINPRYKKAKSNMKVDNSMKRYQNLYK